MNEPSELEFLWWHMRGDFGWLMSVICWITAARLAFKPISGFFESYIAARPSAQTEWAQKLLRSGWWGFLSFALDYLGSIKLPRARTGHSEFFKKPPEPGK